MPDGGARPFWRVFPSDRSARPGDPFSPQFVPPVQGSGRFDLRDVRVLYLAESPEHAVGEKIQRFRGHDLEPWDLTEFGRPLALVPVTVPPGTRVMDLCDPSMLLRHGLRPDHVAARTPETTRSVSLTVHRAGFAGLRWWSSMWGEWHCVTLFLDRVDPETLPFGTPEALDLGHPAVLEAADALSIRVSARRGG